MLRRRVLALLAAVVVVAWFAAPAPSADTAPTPSIKVEKDRVDFRVGSDLFASYHVGKEVAKPYFWPVNAPHGKPVTRGWPMTEATAEDKKKDHKHQKSLWFCHGDVIPEGVELTKKSKHAAGVDFWTEDENHGKIVCVKVGEPKQEKDHAAITTVNEWRSPDGGKIMDETRTVRLYALGTARLLVFDIDLEASVCPIAFGDTKEGSFGVRVRGSVNEEGKGKLTNAEGKAGEGKMNNVARDGCWGMASAWCDYSGPVEDATAGVAIFADPANPVPTCWHARGYGLMAANPFGRAKSGFPEMKDTRKDLVKLAKGEHLKLRYGVLVHTGDVKSGKVAEEYAAFVKLGK